jgi:hypothetical protein
VFSLLDDRPTVLEVPLDHETVMNSGAVPSICVMTKCHSVLSQPWPVIVLAWNEPSAEATAEPARPAAPSAVIPTARTPAANSDRTLTVILSFRL